MGLGFREWDGMIGCNWIQINKNWTFGVSEHLVFTGLYFQFMASFISVCAKMIAYTVPSLHLFSADAPQSSSQHHVPTSTTHEMHHANRPSISSMTHCHSADISPWNPTKTTREFLLNPMEILLKSHENPQTSPKNPLRHPLKIPWKSHHISMEFPLKNGNDLPGTGGKALCLGGASGATRVEPAERCVASSVGKANGQRWGYGFKMDFIWFNGMI